MVEPAEVVTLFKDPENNGVEYLLAVPPTGRGISDALNVRYPKLYDIAMQPR